MRVLQGVLVLISAATMAQAQQAPCVVVGNVVTIQMPNPLRPLPPGGTYYPAPLVIPKRRLSAEDFVAHDGSFHHVPIVSVEPDEGPRRIVLVEVFGEGWRGYVPKGSWQAWSTRPELAAILSTAPPGSLQCNSSGRCSTSTGSLGFSDQIWTWANNPDDFPDLNKLIQGPPLDFSNYDTQMMWSVPVQLRDILSGNYSYFTDYTGASQSPGPVAFGLESVPFPWVGLGGWFPQWVPLPGFGQ